MKRLVMAALILFSSFVPLYAETSDATAIISRMKQALEPSVSSVRRVVIDDRKFDLTRQITLGIATKETANGKRMVLVALAPPDVKGNAVLVTEKNRKESALIIYLPFINRIKEILGREAGDFFLNTQFSYADLYFILADRRATLLGKEDRNGVQYYKVEEMPDSSSPYSTIIDWINTGTGFPMERDFYDKAGKLWKVQSFKDIVDIEGQQTSLRIEMKDVNQGFVTTMKTVMIKYNVDIPDSWFDPEKLSKTFESAFWDIPSNTKGTTATNKAIEKEGEKK